MAKWRTIWEVIYLLQGGRCFYCNAPFANQPAARHTHNGYTRDHVMPRCAGATRTNNVVLACAPCNAKKGNKMPTAEQIAYAQDLYERAKRIHAPWAERVARIPVAKRKDILLYVIKQVDHANS